MQFAIDSSILNAIPGIAVGIIVVQDIDNSGQSEELTSALRSAETAVRSKLDEENYRDHPTLLALQDVHRSFGNNPNKFPPSIQALIKRIVKGGQLPTINPLVDAYNVVSLKHILSCGGEDIDACTGDIVLAYADGTEEFIALGETENTPPKEGEIVYKDDQGVICAKFDWREGDRTKLTPETKNAVLVVETLPPTSREELQASLDELAVLVQEHCGGSQIVHILNAEQPSASW